MTKNVLALACMASITALSSAAHAVSSAELYTTASYRYGRVEARLQFAAGDGVVSSFFLWKDGSELSGTFWNELDFEKVGECHLETNAIYGNPVMLTSQRLSSDLDLCGAFHTYAYEWTPDYIAWSIDGVEIRRDTGAVASAFAQNAAQGMQIRFNIWPGDASFGGNFNPAILPVHQYINWVQYSSYSNGAFNLEWREDFTSNGLPAGWVTANWASPKNLSTHTPANVSFMDGYAVLSLTADNATGPAGAMPMDPGQPDSSGGSGGTAGNAGGAPGSGGAPGGSGGAPGQGGELSGSGGAPGQGGAPSGSGGTPGGGGSGVGAGTGAAGTPGAGSGGASMAERDAGCACRSSLERAKSTDAFALLAVLAGAIRIRRRRARAVWVQIVRARMRVQAGRIFAPNAGQTLQDFFSQF
jgi:endo-1,3-1,4-beta-glycanase ExoK